jgi:hypothetical protein
LDSTTRATPKAQTALTRERERKRDSGEIFYKRPKTFPDKMLNEKKRGEENAGWMRSKAQSHQVLSPIFFFFLFLSFLAVGFF